MRETDGGHAHRGTERITPGGVPIRNVTQPVIRRAFAVSAGPAGQHRSIRTLL